MPRLAQVAAAALLILSLRAAQAGERWHQNGRPTAQALALMQALDNAAQQGLDPADYGAERWARLAQSQTWPKDNPRTADLELSRDGLRYLHDMRVGRANPAPPVKLTPPDEELLAQLSSAPNPAVILQQLEPPFPQYGLLKQALVNYRKLASGPRPRPLHFPTPLKPGEHTTELAALVGRLERGGDLDPQQAPPAKSNLYTGVMVTAVKHFQIRHGLPNSGEIGSATVAALDLPLTTRIAEIKLTMERWRWVPPTLHPPLVIVNIPEFTLRAYDQWPAARMTMEVAVGEVYRHETPPFASVINSITFRPSWTVPTRMARMQLLGELERDPQEYAQQHFVLVTGSGRELDDKLTPARRNQVRSGALMLRQLPGPGNALGLIRFNLADHKEIYLHGTSAAQLFNQTRRTYSHGCIRAIAPVPLAAWMLQKAGWNSQRVEAAENAPQSSLVAVQPPMPILLAYDTVHVTAQGELEFLPDVYHKNEALARRLFGK